MELTRTGNAASSRTDSSHMSGFAHGEARFEERPSNDQDDIQAPLLRGHDRLTRYGTHTLPIKLEQSSTCETASN